MEQTQSFSNRRIRQAGALFRELVQSFLLPRNRYFQLLYCLALFGLWFLLWRVEVLALNAGFQVSQLVYQAFLGCRVLLNRRIVQGVANIIVTLLQF